MIKVDDRCRNGATGAAIVVLAFCFGAGVYSFDGQERLEVTEIWTSESVSDLLLGSVDGLAETPRGTIWISDSKAEEVYSIEPGTGTVTQISQRGEGPGDIRDADRLAVMPDGNIAVFGLSTVEVLTPDGEYARRVHLAEMVTWPKGFVVLPSGGFVISGGVFGIDAAIHLFSPEGKLVRSWEDAPPAENFRARMVGAGGALFAAEEGLLYSQSAPHRIMQYDYDPGSWDANPPRGRMVAQVHDMITHPNDGVVIESGSGENWRRSFHPYFPQSRGVFQMDSGHILNVVVFKDDGYSIWQVFGAPEERVRESPLLPLVTEGRVDKPYVPWFLCNDGTILATRLDPTTDIPIVVRLRINW